MMDKALKKDKKDKKEDEKEEEETADAVLNRLDAQSCALRYKLKKLQEEYESCTSELEGLMKEHPEYKRKEEYNFPESNPLISL